MKTGYLVLITHPDHPDMMRVLIRDDLPNTQESEDGSHIRYIARFTDVEAAQMHLHERLGHTLVDVDTHLYHADLIRAISAAESDMLDHQRVWIDPELDEGARSAIRKQTEAFVLRNRRWDRFWTFVGGFFVVLFILLNLLTV
ncbi:MAG: hypothetical protein ABW101_10525 [Candidatus Thiodiazotropha sp.]